MLIGEKTTEKKDSNWGSHYLFGDYQKRFVTIESEIGRLNSVLICPLLTPYFVVMGIHIKLRKITVFSTLKLFLLSTVCIYFALIYSLMITDPFLLEFTMLNNGTTIFEWVTFDTCNLFIVTTELSSLNLSPVVSLLKGSWFQLIGGLRHWT